ncbi:MAG TPA: hypothetical protein VH877_02075 [Polyangia bacterium]|nr:hypothetical protein [Polyangia bacterium]
MDTIARRRLPLFALTLCALCLAATEARATNYTLWIHGRNTGTPTQQGNYNDWSYWGPAATAAGVNKRAVNWDGKSGIATSNAVLRNALDCFCTGSNFCYVAAHGEGDLQIGYALSLYGTSQRYKKNATPGTGGTCANSDGTTQSGWNLYWVDVASGTGGGSELATSGVYTGYPIDSDTRPATARSLYNHNVTAGRYFYMFAGAKGSLYGSILPGQDDDVVPYHSSGGVSAAGNFCNPSDLFCDGTLTLGTAPTSNGVAKWSYHSVQFRDDAEQYAHPTGGTWSGIVSVVRSDVVTYAL